MFSVGYEVVVAGRLGTTALWLHKSPGSLRSPMVANTGQLNRFPMVVYCLGFVSHSPRLGLDSSAAQCHLSRAGGIPSRLHYWRPTMAKPAKTHQAPDSATTPAAPTKKKRDQVAEHDLIDANGVEVDAIGRAHV